MKHISNEEKAKRIARFNKEFYDEGGANQKYSEEECYNSAIAMAEWKDEQFQKVLDYAQICYGMFVFDERDKFIDKIKEIYYDK